MKIAGDVVFRRAGDEDFARLAALSVLAYPWGGDNAAAREARYRLSASSFGAERIVVERGGRHIAQYANISFTGWIGGVATPVGGLAGVAVAPDARRTGVAGAIVRDHLAAMRARGMAWSMLYPFASSFYAALGWAPAGSLNRFRFAPVEIPRFAEHREVRSLDLSDGETLAQVHRCYTRFCARTNGSLSRTVEHWTRKWRGDRDIAVGVRNEGGELTGYLLATLRAPTPRPQTLVCPELVAQDDRTWRALCGFLAAQADQVATIELDLPVGEPFDALIVRGLPAREDLEIPEEHQQSGTLWSGAMARIIDLPRALRERGYPPGGTGRVAFALRDPQIAENEAPLTLTVSDGVAQVSDGIAPGAPVLRGSIGAATQLLIGALDLAGALRYGAITVDGGADRDRGELGRLLALPRPFPLVFF